MVSQSVHVLDFNSLSVISLGDGGESEDLPDNETLNFVITTLPFYLSKADYRQELAIHAYPLLKSEQLHEAIKLYLKVSFYCFISLCLSMFTGSTEGIHCPSCAPSRIQMTNFPTKSSPTNTIVVIPLG